MELIATYRNAFLIYNPQAGRLRRRPRAVDDAVSVLQSAGHRVLSIATTGPGEAASLARRSVALEADLILVAGGDGTINEVVNGMAQSQVPLAVLPGGTANVFAMETEIGRRIGRAATQVGEWTPQRVALGLYRPEAPGPNAAPRYFLSMCGAGLDATIVYQISAPLKQAIGKVAYWITGFSQLGKRLPEFTVEVDGRAYRASFALTSRVRNYGGDLEIAPSVSLLEDRFEVVLFSGESSVRYLRYMLGVVRRRLESTAGVTILQADRVTLAAPGDHRIYTQVDGEYVGPLPATLEVAPGALTLLLPPRFVASRRVLALQDSEWTTSPTR